MSIHKDNLRQNSTYFMIASKALGKDKALDIWKSRGGHAPTFSEDDLKTIRTKIKSDSRYDRKKI